MMLSLRALPQLPPLLYFLRFFIVAAIIFLSLITPPLLMLRYFTECRTDADAAAATLP